MNERIKELRRQAIDHCLDKGSQGNLSEEVAEKFAELIVQECIRKVEDIAESSNNPQPIYRVAVELLEHFGVEE